MQPVKNWSNCSYFYVFVSDEKINFHSPVTLQFQGTCALPPPGGKYCPILSLGIIFVNTLPRECIDKYYP